MAVVLEACFSAGFLVRDDNVFVNSIRLLLPVVWTGRKIGSDWVAGRYSRRRIPRNLSHQWVGGYRRQSAPTTPF